jgi:enoyl-[acyl-carrier protein] reductase I
VHAIGFAPREAIAGEFLDGLTRENFRIAHDISAYSFPAMAKAALPLLKEGSSADPVLPGCGARHPLLQHHGPGQSLAGSVGTLPGGKPGQAGHPFERHLGRSDQDLAASGIKDFGKLLGFASSHAPLRRNVTIEEVGNTAAFLLSDLASGITGEITYVDGGFSHVMGLNAEDYT